MSVASKVSGTWRTSANWAATNRGVVVEGGLVPQVAAGRWRRGAGHLGGADALAFLADRRQVVPDIKIKERNSENVSDVIRGQYRDNFNMAVISL